MNRVILHGNVGNDPEFRVSNGGMGILKLRIATNERIKKNNVWEDHAEWHSVTVFGNRAESLSKILESGSKVLVEGKLRTSSFEAKDGSGKRYKTEVIADDIELGGSKRGGRGAPSHAEDDQGEAIEPSNAYSPGDDDIPF